MDLILLILAACMLFVSVTILDIVYDAIQMGELWISFLLLMVAGLSFGIVYSLALLGLA